MEYQIIMRTCPGRDEFEQYLVDRIPGLVVCKDKHKNAMVNFIDALRLAGTGAAVHLEDDIELTTGFMEKLDAVIQVRPGVVVQFFSDRRDDMTVGSRWDYGRGFSMNQCFYLPPGYSKSLARYYPRWTRKDEHPTGYDLMMGDWLQARKERYWIHVPSLVQHRQVKSMIHQGRSKFRQSRSYVP